MQTISQVTVVVHPNYLPRKKDYDIALVRLSSPLTFNDYVKPVCLPKTRVAGGTNCVITGWGGTEGKQI